MNTQKIAILTDSCADISSESTERAPIYIVPLIVRCSDGEYDDGVTITADKVYEYLKTEIPQTSLPTGKTVEKALSQIRDAGYEKVIAIMLSGGLSGTCNIVRVTATAFPELEIAVFDSLSGSLGMGLTIFQVIKYIDGGLDWETILERVPKLLANTFPFFSVDTLEYLEKGGRIGHISAIAGSLLQVKPLLSFAQDGKLTSIAKVRGRKNVPNKLIELLRKHLGSGVRYNIATVQGACPEFYPELQKLMLSSFPEYEFCYDATMNSTFGVYLGPGVLGAAVQILDGIE